MRKPNTRQDRGPAVGLMPVPGLYKTRMVRGGPWVPARVYHSIARDPETREPMDRAPQLLCMVAGEDVDPFKYWPMHQIDRAEYDRLLAAMPDDPRAAIDVRRAKTF